LDVELVFDVVDINIVVRCTGCERRGFFLSSFELKREGETPSMAALKEESHQRSNLLTPQKFVWIEPLCTALNSQ
jgi:hypothetical protein